MLSEFRDRLLWALTEPGSGEQGGLLEIDTGAALVVVDGKTPVWFITHGPDDDAASAEMRVRGAIATARGNGLHVALVGADEDVVPAMRRGATAGTSVLRGMHRITLDGVVHPVSGERISSLSSAATRAARGDGPSANELPTLLSARRTMTRHAAAQAQAFVDRVSSGRPLVTYGIVAVCVLMFLLELVWSGSWDGSALGLAFSRMGAGHGELLRAGEWWRALSPAFLHGSFPHIVFNSMALLAFGPLLEVLLGPRRFIALYVLSAIGGHVASAFVRPEVWSVGASAAVWGLMCAGLALFLRPRGLVPPVVAARMKKRIWTPVLLNGLISFMPGIDFAAHLGGGLAGFLLVFSGLLTRGLSASDRQEKRSLIVDLVAGVLLLAAVASVAAAFAHGRPWELREGPRVTRRNISNTGVSLSVPSSLVEDEHNAQEDGATVRTWGDLARDPVVIRAIVTRVGERLPDEGRELRTQGLAQELAALDNKGATVTDPSHVVEVDGRPFATTAQTTSQRLHVRLWATAQDDREILLVAHTRDEASPAWKQLAERVAETVRIESLP